jgi:hypothetical protein
MAALCAPKGWMKERPMRWVLSSLMVLALASPALSAVQHYNHLMIRNLLRAYPHALATPASVIRRLFLAFGLTGGLLSPAFAGDYDLPILRGSDPVVLPVAPPTFRVVSPSPIYRWGASMAAFRAGIRVLLFISVLPRRR